MKSIAVLILFLGAHVFASDFPTLQSKYNTAADKALEPINKVYVQELQKLLEKESKAGNLQAVTLITEELKKFEPKDEKSDKKLTSMFLNTKWVSNLGTTFIFEKNGSATKGYFSEKTLLTWKVIENGFIEVMDSGKPRYFKFANRNQGFYGESLDKLDKTLNSR